VGQNGRGTLWVRRVGNPPAAIGYALTGKAGDAGGLAAHRPGGL